MTALWNTILVMPSMLTSSARPVSQGREEAVTVDPSLRATNNKAP